MPIFQDGHVCGAVAMVMFATAMTMAEAAARYAPALKAAARRITEALAVSDEQAAA